MEQNGKYNFNEALPEIEMPLSPEKTKEKDSKVRLLLVQSAICAVCLGMIFLVKTAGKDAFSALCNAAKETVYRTVSLDEVKSALSSKISEKEQVTNGENYVTPAAPESETNTEQTDFSENAPISPQSEVQSQTGEQSAKPASAVTLNFQKQEQETSVKDITLPVSGEITSDFGSRIHPIYGTNLLHGGIDIGVETGTPVKAALPGTVKEVGSNASAGNFVSLIHSDKVETKYAHLSEVLVSEGDSVYQGQTVALSGNTGVSTGPHLHFEIRIGGVRINPLWVLNFD